MMVSSKVRARTPKNSRGAGYSLLESLIALFVFATAILYLAAGADFALRSGTRSNQESRAALLARSKLSQLRSWLQQSSPNHFANFSSYPNQGSWQPDQFGCETRVDLAAQQTYTPSYPSEVFLPAAERRALDQSLLRARVQVRWGTQPYQQFSLVSLVSDSRRAWRAVNPIVITPVGSPSLPLGQDLTVDLQAVAYDSVGQPIPDVTFTWTVIPGTSVCLLESQRPDGKEATVRHHIPLVPGPGFGYGPGGDAFVAASARYWGQVQVGRYALELQ